MLLYLKVKPNQRFDKIEQTPEGWQVRLKAPAVDGKANENLINYLSEVLDLPKSAIRLKKGQTSKFKCLEINLEEERVVKLLDAESKK
ncbi:MAG: DUF167 domain-containing protein [Bacteroidota bacterium]